MNRVMHRAIRPLAALAAVALTPLAAGAQTAPADMDGTWTAPAGGTVAKAVIAHSGSNYTIHVFAPCSPTPCDWGTRPLTIYAPAVSIHVGKVGSAVFAQGFVTRTVVVTLQDATAPFLGVQVLSKFAPGDTRSNYATTQTLH
jgi:hypothetical protein